jgi:hypothetical protein
MSAEAVPTKNDHRTPESVLAVIRDYAPIGLDPCSNPWSTVGASHSISKHDGGDGLVVCWEAILGDQDDDATVYSNPPYGPGLILPWVHKAADEARRGVETLILVPCSPETAWARAARTFCSAWGPWRRRIAFEGAGGLGMKGPSALYHFGPNRFRFAHHFEDHLAFVEVMPRGAR